MGFLAAGCRVVIPYSLAVLAGPSRVYPSVGDQPEFIGGERDSSPDKRRRGEEAKRLCEGLHSSAVSPLHVPGGARSRGHALFIAPRSRPVNVLGPPMAALAGVNGHPGTRLLANLAAMGRADPWRAARAARTLAGMNDPSRRGPIARALIGLWTAMNFTRDRKSTRLNSSH